jgi:hypothetical protein
MSNPFVKTNFFESLNESDDENHSQHSNTTDKTDASESENIECLQYEMFDSNLDPELKKQLGINNLFKSTWCLWFHNKTDDWRVSGFKMVFEIKNMKNYFDMMNNFTDFGLNTYNDFFLMRKGVTPVWEDDRNRNGAMLSFKVNNNEAYDVWMILTQLLLSEALGEDFNGVSIKSAGSSFIKLWICNHDHDVIDYLPLEFSRKYLDRSIYKHNVPEIENISK